MILDQLQRLPGVQDRLRLALGVGVILRVAPRFGRDPAQLQHIAVGRIQLRQRIQYQCAVAGIDGFQQPLGVALGGDPVARIDGETNARDLFFDRYRCRSRGGLACGGYIVRREFLHVQVIIYSMMAPPCLRPGCHAAAEIA